MSEKNNNSKNYENVRKNIPETEKMLKSIKGVIEKHKMPENSKN